MTSQQHEAGNVLFLVLIAVVLFAALSFAVTMSSRSGSSDLDAEMSQIGTSRLSQNSLDLERAVIRLRISMQIADETISFDNPILTGYDNPACTIDACKVFRPDGGQAPYVAPDKNWLDPARAAEPYFGQWIFTGSTCIPGIGGGHNNCDSDPKNYELVAYMPWLTRATCIHINRKLHVGTPGAEPPQAIGSAWAASPEFTGTYGSGAALLDGGNVLFSQMEGCFQGNGTPPAGSYHYFRVLLPR